jgi:hypothetical protein
MADPTRINTTLDEVLLRMRDRLISQVKDASTANVFLTTGQFQAGSLPPNAAQFIYEVFPDPGVFDQALITAVCENQARVEMDVLIRIWSVIDLDQYDQNRVFLTDNLKGLIPRFTQVLRALHLHELCNIDGDYLLSQPLRPKNYAVDRKEEREQGSLIVGFEAVFDWDLVAPS